ncbi:MAG: DUF4276 family protein [Treponema sp.]|jgi:hypothetical protein|nr:DUF4276 family protein [Treponema sp.]
MKTIAFFLEELSAKVMLEGFINAHFRYDPAEFDLQYRVHEGKQDLENHLENRIKYWKTPDTVFVVMRDQDGGDCLAIKRKLKVKCEAAGHPEAIVRIACHELESFYLGDPAAIEKGLEIHHIGKHDRRKLFRQPDSIDQPSKQLAYITKNKYQKIDGSRKIAPCLNPAINTSKSFNVLYSTLCRLLEDVEETAK